LAIPTCVLRFGGCQQNPFVHNHSGLFSAGSPKAINASFSGVWTYGIVSRGICRVADNGSKREGTVRRHPREMLVPEKR
jgi:hypothetical protein